MEDSTLDLFSSSTSEHIPLVVHGEDARGESNSHINKMYPELNLGLAVPILVRSRSNLEPQKEMSTEVKTSSPDGSLFKIKITARNECGDLITGFDSSVIDVLTTCLREQFYYNKTVLGESLLDSWDPEKNPDFIFVDDLVVTKILGISANSRSKVRKSFQKLRKVILDISSFEYKGKDGQIYKNTGKDEPILGGTFESSFVDLKSGTSKIRKYIRINRTIAENIRNELFTEVDLVKWQGLKAGPQRRLYVFLKSKQKAFGNVFSFDMMEIERVFGLTGHQRSREYIKGYFDDLSSITSDFTFVFKRDTDNNNYEILIEFGQEKLITIQDAFISSLEIVYGIDVMSELGLDVHTIAQYKKDYGGKYKRKTGQDVVKVFNQDHDPVELCLTLSLDANAKMRRLDHFGAYFASLIESVINDHLIIPVGFKSVYERAAVIQKKSEEFKVMKMKESRLAREQREEAQYAENVGKLIMQLQANPELKRKATRIAKERVKDAPSASYDFELAFQIQNVFKEWIEDCDSENKILQSGDLLLLGNEYEENLTLKLN